MRWAVLGLLLMGVAGCSSAPPLSADEQRQAALYLADYTDSRREQLTFYTGSYRGKTFDAEFVAFLEDAEVRSIDERIMLGGGRELRLRFYFRQGALYLLRQQLWQNNDTVGQGLVIFDQAGAPLLEEALPVPDAALGGADLQAHAAVLLRAVRARPVLPEA